MYYNNKLNAKEKKLKNISTNKHNKRNINSKSFNNIKVTDIEWSSYNYNNKVGLNTPLSFQELAYNSKDSYETDKNIRSINNINNNDNGYDNKKIYNKINFNGKIYNKSDYNKVKKNKQKIKKQRILKIII